MVALGKSGLQKVENRVPGLDWALPRVSSPCFLPLTHRVLFFRVSRVDRYACRMISLTEELSKEAASPVFPILRRGCLGG